MPASAKSLPALTEGFRALEREAQEWQAECHAAETRWLLLRSAAARYVGQDFELEVEVPPGSLTERELEQIVAGFHEAHRGRYGYALPGHPVEFVDLIVTAVGKAPRPREPLSGGPCRAGEGAQKSRAVLVGGRDEPVTCSVYERAGLRKGDTVYGPAIVEQYDSTTYLPPGWTGRVEGQGSFRVRTGVSR